MQYTTKPSLDRDLREIDEEIAILRRQIKETGCRIYSQQLNDAIKMRETIDEVLVNPR